LKDQAENRIRRALSRLGDRALAEDLTQEIFLRIYQGLAGFSLRCRFTTWLFQVTKNRVLDELRARERRPRACVTLDDMPTLEVLDRPNAALYWERESRHDTVISLTYGRPALDALCRVIEAWVAHFNGLEVSVKPLRQIEEGRWAWHIGLDVESTEILNALWAGDQVDPGRMRNIVALFGLQFADPAAMRRDIAGRTVYLALSANAEQEVRMKPQNLLINLPLHEA